MGILDSLFGLGQTGATDSATNYANQFIANTAASNANQLNTSATNASGDLQTGVNNASGAMTSGYGQATGALTGYDQQAQGALQTGINSAVGTDQSSNAAYSPYVASGQGAHTMQANALGLNGAAGNAAATGAFQASPGYQWNVDQATDAASRKAASLGVAGSGNTLDAITRLGSNLANNEYSNWLTNLTGLGSQGLTAANAVSANNQAAGALQGTGATTGANLYQQTGSGLGTLDALQANGQSTLQSGLGTGLAGIQTNLGNSLVNNSWAATNAINGNSLGAAKADDSATNTNNGILAKLFQGAAGGALSSLKL